MESYAIPRKQVAVPKTYDTDGSNIGSLQGAAPPVDEHPAQHNSKLRKAMPNEKPRGWWKWGKEGVQDQMARHLATEFNGGRGYNGQWFRRPVKQKATDPFDNAAILESDEKGRYLYRNELGQLSYKYDDVVAYLSPTNSIPRRLVVQGTDYVWKNKLKTGDWRRTKLSGSVPLVLKVAEWALGPSNPNESGKVSRLGRVNSAIRILVVGLPLQILLSFPTTASWEDGTVDDFYVEFPGYYWKWPKHAINPLDMRPSADNKVTRTELQSSKKRLLRPRQLVVLRDGKWVLDPNPDRRVSYLFISYANMHFDTNNSETGRRMIEDMAAFATLQAGRAAYWLDFRCRAPEAGPLLDSDVYRMCDVIRGSYQVVVMLKGD